MAKVCKFQIEKERESFDCGRTWQDTGNKRKIQGKEPVESPSYDCGWSDNFLYKWETVEDDYFCNGYDKYTKKKLQVSYDNGTEWEDVDGSEQIGEFLDCFSSDCCYIREITANTCDNFYRYVNETLEEASLDMTTWVKTGRFNINEVLDVYHQDCIPNNLKYLGIPVDAYEVSGTSAYAISYCEMPLDSIYIGYNMETTPQIEHVQVDYYDAGNIEDLYVFDCAGLKFSTNSQNTLKRIHFSSGCSGMLGTAIYHPTTEPEGLDFSGCTELEELIGLEDTNIVSIADYVFKGCTSLKTVSLPRSLTTLHNGCFESCTSLSSVTINSVVLADGSDIAGSGTFVGCTSLETVEFQDYFVGKVVNDMFAGCTSLSSITLGNVTEIGSGAFQNCVSLKEINFGNNIEILPQRMMQGCTDIDLYFPVMPPTIYNNTFSGVRGRLHVSCADYDNWCALLPTFNSAAGGAHIESVSIINDECFTTRWTDSGTTCVGYDKYNLEIKQVSCDCGITWYTTHDAETRTGSTLIEHNSPDCGYIPPNAKVHLKYGKDEYYYSFCNDNTTLTSGETKENGHSYTAMTEAVIGDCVETIGTGAFNGCNSLTSVTIGSGVTVIGTYGFRLCTSLSSITIPNSVVTISSSAFTSCRNITNIDIPDNVVTIGNYAFYGCDGLTGITIGSGLTSIGSSGFVGCEFTSVNIPDSVTSIGNNAFSNCTSITSVTIGSGITSIGGYAFGSSTRMVSVTIKAANPPSVVPSRFPFWGNCPIYVPAASVDRYKTARYWSDYADRIQPIS